MENFRPHGLCVYNVIYSARFERRQILKHTKQNFVTKNYIRKRQFMRPAYKFDLFYIKFCFSLPFKSLPLQKRFYRIVSRKKMSPFSSRL
jgi:hypothetical protein